MTMEAIFPDGRKEVLSQVDKYGKSPTCSRRNETHSAHRHGAAIHFSFDNTADNPINPDPEQWVVFGRRGVDEMSHAWLGITYLNEEQCASHR